MNSSKKRTVPLRDLLSPVSRRFKVIEEEVYTSLGIKWYAKGLFKKDRLLGSQIKATQLFRVAAGDFIYNRLFAWKGSFALAGSEHAGCVVSGEFPTFRVDERRILLGYLLAYFSNDALWDAIAGKSSGTSQTSRLRFKEADFLNLPISLPPLPEQERIVRLLDAAEDLRRLREQADRRTADLVPALFHEMFGDPAKISTPVPKLAEVAEIASGVAKGRRFNGQRTVMTPYLRVANVQAGYLDLSEMKMIEALPEEVEELALRTGDVLLTEGGDFDKLGRGAMWESAIPNCIHQNHVFRVRVDQSKLIPLYLTSLLQTEPAKSYFLRCAKKTTNLASINMRQLRGLPVPLPPLPVQREFVARVSDVRAMEAKQAESRRRLDDLLQSLLHRAFRGEL